MSRKSKIACFSIPVLVVAIFLLVMLNRFSGDVSIGETLLQNGFVELKPPSTLVSPGTWVSILNTNPLHLGVVCTPATSLGLRDTSNLLNSASADADLISKLKGKFQLGADAISKVKGKGQLTEVKKITFQLKNIRILELPDQLVMEGILKREPYCSEAIRFRIKENQAISMIKSVLIADVDYRVEFNRELKSKADSDLKKQLALEMDLRMEAGEDGKSALVGRDLIWGIREDASLAKYGLTLPATGGTNSSDAILAGKGSVKEISIEGGRQKFAKMDGAISYDVPPLKQTSPMSCWATVYAMMVSAREHSPTAANSAVAALGSPWDDYYIRDSGLPYGKEKEFVKSAGLRSEPPASYTLAAYVDMLRKYGPLWIITGDGISAHARLLVGIYTTAEIGDVSSAEAYEHAIFEFIDPLVGTYQYEPALELMQKFESEARWLVSRKFDDIEFRDQILHWP